MKSEFVLFFVAAIAALTAGENAFPQSYSEFWAASPALSPLSLACVESLPRLNISNAVPLSEYAQKRFSDVSGFAHAAQYAALARTELEAAKQSSTLRLPLVSFPLYSEYAFPAVVAGSLAANNPFITLPTSCLLSFVDVPNFCREVRSASCAGMGHAVNALAYATFSAEEARQIAFGEADELARMGAGCNYSGSETAVLAQARLAISGAVAAAETPAWEVHDAFQSGSARALGPAAYADAFNAMVGSGGVLETSITVTISLRAAQDSMKQSYASSLDDFSVERAIAQSELARLEGEGYARLDSVAFSRISALSGNRAASGAFKAASPLDTLREACALIREADFLALEARNNSRSNDSCSFSSAISSISGARESIRLARDSLSGMENEALGELSACESTARTSLSVARIHAENANVSANPVSASRKAGSLSQLEKAQAILDSARGSGAGARAAACEQAASLIVSANAVLSDENASMNEVILGANRSLDELERTAKLAENDGLDSRMEAEFISDARGALAYATAEDLSAVISRCRSLADGLYAKADARFGFLSPRLAALVSEVSSIRAYSLAAENSRELARAMAVVEMLSRNYTAGGAFNSRLALGHFREVQSALEDAERVIGSERGSLISQAIKLSARTSCPAIQSVAIDGPYSRTAVITFENPYPFGVDSALPIVLDNDCGLSSSSFKGDFLTYAYADGSEVNLLLSRVSAESRYSLTLNGAQFTPVRLLASDYAVTSLSPSELNAVIVMSYSSSEAVEQLSIPVNFPFQPVSCSAESSNAVAVASALNSDAAAISLVRVPAGEGTLRVRCAYKNPFSLEEERVSISENANSSFTSCTDFSVNARTSLPDFNASIGLPNSTIPGSISVSGDDAAGISYRLNGFSVEVPLAPMAAGSRRAFNICYEFVNASAYANELFKGAQARIDALAAGSHATPGELLAASAALAAASQQVNAQNASASSVSLLRQAAANVMALENVAAERLAANAEYESSFREWESARTAAADDAEGLEYAGFTAEAAELGARISSADAISTKSLSLAGALDYSGASAILNRAIAALELPSLEEKILGGIEGNASAADTLETAASALAFYGPADFPQISRARTLLSESRDSLASGDRGGALRSLSESGILLSNASTAVMSARATAVSRIGNASASFRKLQKEAADAVAEFDTASIPSEGNRRPAGSSLATLSNKDAARKTLETECGELDAFFTEFANAGSAKDSFSLERAADAQDVFARVANLNSSTARLKNASAAYGFLAESMLSEAQLKQAQTISMLPKDSYAPQLSSIANLTDSASSAFGEKRFADAIIYAEKSIAEASKLANGASIVEQNARSNGFELQPVHLLIPAILLAFLAAYWKGKNRKPKELKRIPRASETAPNGY